MIRSEIVNVTPEIASRILLEQDVLSKSRGEWLNRNIVPARVAQYARAMANGEWRLNGETVIFNGRRLMNGQHRLHAVVKSECIVPMLFVHGVEEDAFITMDQGVVRTAPQMLQGRGLKNSNNLAAMAAVILEYERLGYMRLSGGSGGRASAQEVVAFTIQHQDELQDAHQISNSAARLLGWGRVLGAIAYFARNRRHHRATFYGALESGENLSSSSPMHCLRERLLRERRNISRQRTEGLVISAMVIKAWNSHVTDAPMRILRYALDDEYPTMIV